MLSLYLNYAKTLHLFLIKGFSAIIFSNFAHYVFSSVLQKANGYLFHMNNTGFIARRYLFSKKHISLITTLTTISITGVTLGTALLIVVLSVFNGFFDVIKDLLLASDPDIRIEATNNRYFKLEDNLSNQLQEVDGIHTISP